MRKKILIVDDESIILEYLAYEFNYNGFHVLLAQSGNEAIELCKKTPEIELILTDIRMKNGDGHQLNSFIQAQNQDCKFFFMSADQSITPEDVASFKANGFFRKPFDFDYVIKQIKDSAN